jgi:hypothetical protein
MPKNECDPEDPLELHGVELATNEEGLREMAFCFAEEFMRDGWSEEKLLEMFKSPFYHGPHLVWKQKGEAFVRGVISEVANIWRSGRRIG